jgi:hypothetical protein
MCYNIKVNIVRSILLSPFKIKHSEYMNQEIAELIANEHTRRLFISLTNEFNRNTAPSPSQSEAMTTAKDRRDKSLRKKVIEHCYELSKEEVEEAGTVEEIRTAWAGTKDDYPELEQIARIKWTDLSLTEINTATNQIEVINAIDMSPMNGGLAARPLGIIKWDEISLEAVQAASSDLELAITAFLSHRNSEARKLAIQKLKELSK